jgi:hypothetical protein
MFKFLFSTFFIFILWANWPLWAQLDNTVFKENLSLNPENKNKLYFNFKTLGYLRNNEYFNPITSGQTFFGYWLNPSFSYLASERIRLELGVFVQEDYGSSKYFSQLTPFFRFQYQKDSTTIIFGNLQSNLQHQLIEPIYAFERFITQNLENGLQIKHQKKWLDFDLWVDWQQSTQRGSTQQERIWGGLSNQFKLIRKPNFSLHIPLQISLLHLGGQGIQSFFPSTNSLNTSLGLKMIWPRASEKFIREISTESYWVYSHTPNLDTAQFRQTNTVFMREGNALFTTLNFKTRWFQTMFNWWYAYNFDSAQGGELYRSYPSFEGGFEQKRRNLLFIRFLRDFKLFENTFLTLRFEPYYDFINRRIEHSQGFYITYRPNFYLAKLKNN